MEPLANPHLPLQLSKNRQSGLGAPVGAQESHVKMAVIRGTLGFLMPCGRSSRLRQIIEAVPVHRRSEEHTSELQSLMRISYAVFCLNKKKSNIDTIIINHH